MTALLVWILRADAQECAKSVSLVELDRQVQQALLAPQAPGGRLPYACLSDALSPTVAAGLFYLEGRRQGLLDGDRMSLETAALDVLRPQTSNAVDDTGVWATVTPPDGVELLVDGWQVSARPRHRPAFLQARQNGRILWTELLLPVDPLPAGFIEGATTAPEAPEALLLECSGLLEAGRYAEALERSLAAMSQYPDRTPSFRAVSELALDGIRASPSNAEPAPPAGIPAPTSGDSSRDPTRTPASVEPRGFRLGFQAGLPTGLRAEYGTGLHRSVDSWGVRAGGTLAASSEALAWDVVTFLDWQMHGDWQVETWAGVLTPDDAYQGPIPYFEVGAGLQWDPPNRAVQVDLGVGAYAEGLAPVASTGFVW